MGGNPQEESFTDTEHVLLETKIEYTPKQVAGLESIAYIAAGLNHSLAITSKLSKGHEQQVYSWGCGWNGQTGLGSWMNQYCPE